MPAGNKKHILIVGAGPGGLTAGMLLAHRGFRVTIVEKNDRVGGRNSEVNLDGFSFDLGPTFLHQKFCLDEIFAETGSTSEDHLDFVDLNPMTRLSWGNTSLHTYSDTEKMSAEIERVFPGSSEGFRRYMSEHAVKFRKIYPCLQHPYHNPAAYLRPGLLRALPYVLTNRSVHDVLGDYFDEERLKLAFTFQAKYLGMSPWHCPALFSILSFTEYRYGVYHVQGGLNRISHAMADVFAKLGGELRLHSPVKQLRMSGKTSPARNSKTARSSPPMPLSSTRTTAMPPPAFSTATTFPRRRCAAASFPVPPSCSIWAWTNSTKPSRTTTFSSRTITRRTSPTFKASVTFRMTCRFMCRNSCVTDPHVAPPGQSGLYVLVPTINTRHGFDWENHKEEYADKILRRIEERTSHEGSAQPHRHATHHLTGRLGKLIHLHGCHVQSRPHARADALHAAAQPLSRIQ